MLEVLSSCASLKRVFRYSIPCSRQKNIPDILTDRVREVPQKLGNTGEQRCV
jgi:hypothetical protein